MNKLDDYDKGAIAFLQGKDKIPDEGCNPIEFCDGWFDAETCTINRATHGIQYVWLSRMESIAYPS